MSTKPETPTTDITLDQKAIIWKECSMMLPYLHDKNQTVKLEYILHDTHNDYPKLKILHAFISYLFEKQSFESHLKEKLKNTITCFLAYLHKD